jgi:hypothetical protein
LTLVQLRDQGYLSPHRETPAVVMRSRLVKIDLPGSARPSA